jgi:Ca2+-binding EF-hand superfamily protein
MNTESHAAPVRIYAIPSEINIKMQDEFRNFDPADTSRINVRECRVALRNAGFDVNNEIISDMLQNAAQTQKGKVKYEQYLGVARRVLVNKLTEGKEQADKEIKELFEFIVATRPKVDRSLPSSQIGSPIDVKAILHARKNAPDIIMESNYIYLADLRRVSRTIGEFLTEADVHEMFVEGDRINQGKMSYLDFERVMKRTVYCVT